MAVSLPRQLQSTSLRLVIYFFLAQFVTVMVVIFSMQAASERLLLSEQQTLVAELKHELSAVYENGGRAELVAAIEDRIEFRHGQIAVILLTSPDGTLLAGNLDAWPPTVEMNEEWAQLQLYRKVGAKPELIGLSTSELADGSHLLTGHVIEGGIKLRSAIGSAVLLAILVAVPLALGAALILGRSIEQRISAIALTVADVSKGNLSRRVRNRHTGDAFDRLGKEINDMLERIEHLVTELRVVTDSLAHDLRSPVTRLTSAIERGIIESDDPNARATLESVAQEARQLQEMLSTALQISRAEAGIGRENFVVIRLGDLLGDIVEIYGPLAEDAGFRLSSAALPKLELMAHRELLSQALGNLVDNAVTYAVGGDAIRLSAAVDGESVVVEVADNGAGIPEELRTTALSRFGRLDPSRHASGSGLGLSLVEAVARLHGGSVHLDDNAPGLIVRINLPMSDA